MRNKLTLYIPATLMSYRMEYVKRMARRFGGATVTEGWGSWINGEGELEQEPVFMVQSWLGHADMMGAHVLIRQFVHDLLKADEEAVMYVLNGEAFIATDEV